MSPVSSVRRGGCPAGNIKGEEKNSPSCLNLNQIWSQVWTRFGFGLKETGIVDEMLIEPLLKLEHKTQLHEIVTKNQKRQPEDDKDPNEKSFNMHKQKVARVRLTLH